MLKHTAKIKATRLIVSDKIKEAFSSVLPITAIVLFLGITFVPIQSGMFLSFIIGALLTVVGMGLFTLGADTAMTPIGEYVARTTVKSKKIWFMLPVFFSVGTLITVAEPDLQVLAGQLSGTVAPLVLLLSVGIGVGLFLVTAFLRILWKIKLKWILLIFYIAVFIMSFFVPKCFVPLAFDSGGVTTGPMSVPFIISIGTGIAAIRSDGNAEEDSFGLTALCSVGPILSVMILGLITQPTSIVPAENAVPTLNTSLDMAKIFAYEIPHYMKEVAIGLIPIVLLFFIFRIFGAKTDKRDLLRIIIGLAYTYIGLVLFLSGANIGFLPVGSFIGKTIGAMPYKWIIIPIGFVIGFFVVAAEPAVHVLTKRVYEITSGAIPPKALLYSLMIGVGASVALAMLRILLHIEIMYFLIPAYVISLVLMFVVPDIFTGIAFDSGGVASGAMTASFVLPLALGLCEACNGDIASDGFGVVAFVAMTPLITIQLLGLIFRIKQAKIKKQTADETEHESIID